MIFYNIVFEAFVVYNISQIISESKISRPVRDYFGDRQDKNVLMKVVYELISCFLCVSVWVGFIVTNFLFNFAQYMGYDSFSWFWNGLFFSSLAWFMNVWEQNKLK